MIISISCCQKRKHIYDFLLSTESFAKISYLNDFFVTYQSVKDHSKKWHRFRLHLHDTVIFISDVQIPAQLQNKLIMDLNSDCHDCSIQKNIGKVQWFLADRYGRISHQ